MNTKNISKVINTIFITSIIFCLQGCSPKDKQMVLADDVKEDIVLEEGEINDLINKGNDYLSSSEFDKAKECYEKAISIDITKESTYLTIKDNYIKANRYDDAYYIIKLAIDNNVSKENMTNILADIQAHFTPTLISETITEGDPYTLPSEVLMSINNTDINVPVRWNDSTINTSNSGTFTFEGHVDEYGRTVNLTLTINSKSEVSNKTISTENSNQKNTENSNQKGTENNKQKSTENRKQKYLTKLDNIQSSLSDLDELYAGSTLEMRAATNEEFKRWDAALNEIYSELKNSLSSSDIAKLEKEELNWIKNRDKKAKEAAALYEGGTVAALSYDSSMCESTKERCYELVNKYM